MSNLSRFEIEMSGWYQCAFDGTQTIEPYITTYPWAHKLHISLTLNYKIHLLGQLKKVQSSITC